MGNIWWEDIQSSKRFINDIVKGMKDDGNSVVLHIPDGLPWIEGFRRLVVNGLKEDSERMVKVIDHTPSDIGKYMLENYCRKEKRFKYRPRSNFNEASFLGQDETSTLKTCYVIIHNASDKEEAAWLRFIEEYYRSCQGVRRGIFLIESSAPSGNNGTRGVQHLFYIDYIAQQDIHAYTSMCIGEESVSRIYRSYLSELLSQVSSSDLEILDDLLWKWEEVLERPLETFLNAGLSLSEDELRKRIWKAQIRVVFPEIEEFRCDIVSKYRQAWETFLPWKTDYTIIDNVENLELSFLLYMAKNRSIMDERDYRYTQVFVEARNELAHLGILDFKHVEAILGRESQKTI